MEFQIKAPTVGESITEVRILKWLKPNGAAVKNGELVVEIETDKASVEVASEANGALKIIKAEGETIPIGEVIGVVDDSVKGTAGASPMAASPKQVPAGEPHNRDVQEVVPDEKLSPSVRRMASENNIDTSRVQGSAKDGRLTKEDLMKHLSGGPSAPAPVTQSEKTYAPTSAPAQKDRPGDRRVAMTRIRAKIAERLVQAQHTAAILTTFNEVDMSAVNGIRSKHKEAFKAKNGTNLSYMSFFTRACYLALKQLPDVNASVDGKDVIYHDYYDIGIAVGTERGLVVPVLRNVEKMTFVDIEKKIGELAVKARDSKLSLADMEGGTFTISNGGTYGSLLSTPILNPPQSAILGMHKIQDRPIAVEGKVEIRPMMYLALSYDHRIIDGKGAVTFLITVRDLLENPQKLGMEFV